LLTSFALCHPAMGFPPSNALKEVSTHTVSTVFAASNSELSHRLQQSLILESSPVEQAFTWVQIPKAPCSTESPPI
jgi:hypothetical protein